MNADVLAFLDPEHGRGVATVDCDRDVPVGVLVEDDVARPGVRERACGDRVVALRAGQQFDPSPGNDPGLVEVRAVEIEADVPEPVDRENGRVDARGADVGPRDVEPGKDIGIERRPERAEGDAEREMRGRRREEVAAVKRARDGLERVVGIGELAPGSAARCRDPRRRGPLRHAGQERVAHRRLLDRRRRGGCPRA